MKCLLIFPTLMFAMLHGDAFIETNNTKTPIPNSKESNASEEVVIIDDSITRGRAIFMKKVKKACGMNGIEFAAKHTQDEWEMIRNLCSFKTEAARICPNIKALNPKLIGDLYKFTFEYAKDSGNVPSCEDDFDLL